MEIEGVAQPTHNQTCVEAPTQVARGERVILVDGSWDTHEKGGVGMAVYNRRGDLVYVNFHPTQPLDSLHVNALVAIVAMRYVMQEGSQCAFIIFSDNKNMVQVINGGKISELTSWKAAEAVMSTIILHKEEAHKMKIQHITRRALRAPHNLVN